MGPLPGGSQLVSVHRDPQIRAALHSRPGRDGDRWTVEGHFTPAIVISDTLGVQPAAVCE